MIHHLNLKNGSRGIKPPGAATKLVGSVLSPQPHTHDPDALKRGMRSRLPWSSCPPNLLEDTPNHYPLQVGRGESMAVVSVVPQYPHLDQSTL